MENKTEFIIQKYKEGLSIAKIGKLVGLSYSVVRKRLLQNNINLRAAKPYSKIGNPRYFEKIDTATKAYFLGLLIADGNVGIDERKQNDKHSISYYFRLTLKNEDKYILEALNKELMGTGKIYEPKKRNESSLSYSSKEMFEDLSQYGVVPNKTFYSYLPVLDDELMPHLIRGIFDGDGTVFIRTDNSKKHKIRLEFGFAGTELLCSQIKEYLQKVIQISDNKVLVRKDRNVSQLMFSKLKDIESFYNFIYSDSNVFLKRKRKKFDEFLFLYANTEVTV